MTSNCRLAYKGFHQLELRRCGGAEIVIGGQVRELQESPPNVASRLPVDTDQFIYARWDEGQRRVKLEASTEGHETAGGYEVKAGDPSRTLVGMGRPFEQRHRHYHWAHRPDSLRILTRYNRGERTGRKSLPGEHEISFSDWDEVSADFRMEFLAWGDAPVSITASGEVRGERDIPCLALGFGGGASDEGKADLLPDPAGRGWRPFTISLEKIFSAEGNQSVTLLGRAGPESPVAVRGATLSISLMG